MFTTESQAEPAYIVENGSVIERTDLTLWRITEERDWRPTLSTGPVLFVESKHAGIGIGIGGHIVFVTDSEGTTKPFPGATLHVGSQTLQAFIGKVWLEQPRIQYLNNARAIYVPRDGPEPRPFQSGNRRTAWVFGAVVSN